MTGRLVIIGSGETAPTMVKVHRSLIEASPSGPRAMLDTPFGFQANADDLTGKVQDYFAEAVGSPIEVARWRRRDEALTVRERSLALLDRSSYVFAGPGSPTYALGQWRDGRPRPANGQDLVMPRHIMKAPHQKIGQIVVADGFAGGQLPIAKNQKRFAFFDTIELSRQRFEKSSGPHDGISQA